MGEAGMEKANLAAPQRRPTAQGVLPKPENYRRDRFPSWRRFKNGAESHVWPLLRLAEPRSGIWTTFGGDAAPPYR